MPSTPPSNNLNSQPVSIPAEELTHITEEMYKKNSELNDRNKTLALLRKIDTIVLSSVTDPRLIAQKVTDLLVEEEYKLVSLFYLKNFILYPLSISSVENDYLNQIGKDRLLNPPISLFDKENVLVKTAETKSVHVIFDLFEIYKKNISENEAKDLQQKLGLKCMIIYPLVVRADTIGVMVIGLPDVDIDIEPDKKSLVDRLAGVVGIALDNALLYQSIQEANERLKQLDKLKDEFVSLASHELRTPMTVIKSYLWMLLYNKKRPLDPKDKMYLERAYGSVERLIKLVNDMLNVSRIESGRLKLEMKDLDIVNLVTTVCSELMPRAQELGLKMYLDKPSTPVKKLNGDSDRIEQILINFIGNSLKFTPPGGSITVTLKAREKDVLIIIKDTGRGIKKEDMHKLFQKFGMIGSAYLQKSQNQGSGLGLYLSKSLIELHGGRVHVESAGENKGALFSFNLPYNDDKPHQEAAVLPAAVPAGGVATAGAGAGVK
jgi:signal transduction histidine kinase